MWCQQWWAVGWLGFALGWPARSCSHQQISHSWNNSSATRVSWSCPRRHFDTYHAMSVLLHCMYKRWLLISMRSPPAAAAAAAGGLRSAMRDGLVPSQPPASQRHHKPQSGSVCRKPDAGHAGASAAHSVALIGPLATRLAGMVY
jgi:hypothetical protein